MQFTGLFHFLSRFKKSPETSVLSVPVSYCALFGMVKVFDLPKRNRQMLTCF